MAYFFLFSFLWHTARFRRCRAFHIRTLGLEVDGLHSALEKDFSVPAARDSRTDRRNRAVAWFSYLATWELTSNPCSLTLSPNPDA